MSEQEKEHTQELNERIQQVVNRMAVLVGAYHAQGLSGEMRFRIRFEDGEVTDNGYEEAIRPRLNDG